MPREELAEFVEEFINKLHNAEQPRVEYVNSLIQSALFLEQTHILTIYPDISSDLHIFCNTFHSLLLSYYNSIEYVIPSANQCCEYGDLLTRAEENRKVKCAYTTVIINMLENVLNHRDRILSCYMKKNTVLRQLQQTLKNNTKGEWILT